MTKKLSILGLLASVAIIFGYVETMIPIFIGYYGIKLGLANLVILFILIKYSWKEAAIISFVRILVVGFLFGRADGIIYSLSGAALSMIVMIILLKKTSLSLWGVSVAGAVCHNAAQLMVAVYITQSTALLVFYGPVLLILGIITGLLIAWLTTETMKRVRI